MNDPMPEGDAVTAEAITTEGAEAALRALLEFFPCSFPWTCHAA